MKCTVFGCTNGYKKSTVECSLFTFPTNPSLARQWMKFCRQKEGYNFKNCVICMDHFTKEDVANNLQYDLGFANKRILKRDAVPTIYKVEEKTKLKGKEKRSERVQRRENKKIVFELLAENPTSNEGFSKRRLLKHEAVPTLYDDNVESEIDEATKLENKRIVDELLKQYDADLTQAEELKETTIDISENIDDDIEDFLKNEHTVVATVTSKSPVHVSYTQNCDETVDIEQRLVELKRSNVELQKENNQHRIELLAAKRILIGEQRRHRYEMKALSKRLTEVKTQKKNYEKKLQSIFSKAQLEIIKNNNSVNWSKSDIEEGRFIYTTNSKIYKFLLRKGFPLPSIRTIQFYSQEEFPQSLSPTAEISTTPIKKIQEQEQNEQQQQDDELYEQEQHQQSSSSLESLVQHNYSEEIEFEILN